MMKTKILISLIGMGIVLIGVFLISTHVQKPAEVEERPAPLQIEAPAIAEVGEIISFTATSQGSPVEDVLIQIGDKAAKTGRDGKASLSIEKPGDYSISVRKEGYEGAPKVLFQDGFENGTSQWHFHIDTWRFATDGISLENEDGNVFLRMENKSEVTWATPREGVRDEIDVIWGNYSWKFNFRLNQGTFHANFRQNNRGRYYLIVGEHVRLGKDIFALGRTDAEIQEKGVWSEEFSKNLAEKELNLVDGKWHEIEIAAIENEFWIYIDDELIFDAVDTETRLEARPLYNGPVAIMIEPGTTLDIDNVKVTFASVNPEVVSEIRIYPLGNEEIEIRGVKEHWGIDGRKNADGRTVGANWMILTPEAEVDEITGEVVPRLDLELIRDRIRSYHARRYNVMLNPSMYKKGTVYGRISVPENVREEFLKNAENWATELAEFAEANGVEMFTPVNRLEEGVPFEIANEWYQQILPKVREVYSGKVIIGMNPAFDKEFNYGGFDYVTAEYNWYMPPIHLYPDENYRLGLRKWCEIVQGWRDKYQTDGIIFTWITFGAEPPDFYLQEHAKGKTFTQIKIEILELIFEETSGTVDGFFITLFHEDGRAKFFKTETKGHYYGYQGPEIEEFFKEHWTLG
jgi:hypothetical protein